MDLNKIDKYLKEVQDKGILIQSDFKKASMSVDKYVGTKMGKDNIHYRNINKSLKEIKNELSKVVGLEL